MGTDEFEAAVPVCHCAKNCVGMHECGWRILVSSMRDKRSIQVLHAMLSMERRQARQDNSRQDCQCLSNAEGHSSPTRRLRGRAVQAVQVSQAGSRQAAYRQAAQSTEQQCDKFCTKSGTSAADGMNANNLTSSPGNAILKQRTLNYGRRRPAWRSCSRGWMHDALAADGLVGDAVVLHCLTFPMHAQAMLSCCMTPPAHAHEYTAL